MRSPNANWCETWKSGAMLKTFVRSARTPVNMWLLRKASRCTSRESVSMVPGLDRPSLALRSEKELRASPIVTATGLEKRMERIASSDDGDGDDAMEEAEMRA